MRTPSQPTSRIPAHAAESFGKVRAQRPAEVTQFESARRRLAQTARMRLRGVIRPSPLRADAGPRFGAAANESECVATPLAGERLQQASSARRSAVAGRLLASLVRWLAAAARSRLADMQRRRLARLTTESLRGLDAYTLRDIGLDRSEIGSVVAEMSGAAQISRRHAWRHHPDAAAQDHAVQPPA